MWRSPTFCHVLPWDRKRSFMIFGGVLHFIQNQREITRHACASNSPISNGIPTFCNTTVCEVIISVTLVRGRKREGRFYFWKDNIIDIRSFTMIIGGRSLGLFGGETPPKSEYLTGLYAYLHDRFRPHSLSWSL